MTRTSPGSFAGPRCCTVQRHAPICYTKGLYQKPPVIKFTINRSGFPSHSYQSSYSGKCITGRIIYSELMCQNIIYLFLIIVE